MPNPGTFTLHSHVIPDLPAGHYVVHTQQSFTAPGATASALDAHVEVTAPRFVLPPDQVLSTYPPNQAEGAFSSRLPQIVLKRRTLPWEREIDGKLGASAYPREIPWLALVVLADGECEFKTGRPIADCVTPGVVLEGRSDTPVANSIVVTAEVVRQVFPCKQELQLLAHVRNVDLSDTELALGDDDGWLAVLLSNRLPQPGTRYRACLISIEGQYEVLPDVGPVAGSTALAMSRTFVYEYAARESDNISFDSSGGRMAASSGRSSTLADGWSSTSTSQPAAASHPPRASTKIVGAMHSADMSTVAPNEPQYTFPVLAQWQFTCTGNQDFQSLMQGLDVGMLGTLPPLPPPTQVGEKPPPPPTRQPPEIVDTGHIALQHVSREGEPGKVWYRGPLVPRPTSREQPDGAGRLPLLHASDQARRVGPDGRENLSLAAAFEIGRLLALAEPGVVAAMLNWRKQELEQARQDALLDLEPVLSMIRGGVAARFALRAGLNEIVRLGASDAALLGSLVPQVDPGRPIPGVADAEVAQVLSTGLAIPIETVRDVLAPGVNRAGSLDVPVSVQVAALDALAADADRQLAPLRSAIAGTAAAIAADVADPKLSGARKRLDMLITPEEL